MSKKDYSFIHHHLWVGALLCMCLLCQLSVVADDYKPILKDGRSWNYIEVHQESVAVDLDGHIVDVDDPRWNSDEEEWYTFTTVMDTISRTYYIIGTETIDNRLCYKSFSSNSSSFGYLYEEDGKVYSWRNGEWVLGMDVTLEVGDACPNRPEMRIQSVDTINVHGQLYRRLWLGYSDDEGKCYWIEGMGSTSYGPFPPIESAPYPFSLRWMGIVSVYDGDTCIFERKDFHRPAISTPQDDGHISPNGTAWMYCSLDNWQQAGDTVYCNGGRQTWSFITDDDNTIERNGHRYVCMRSEEIGTTTDRSRMRSTDDVRTYTIALRRADRRVYVDREDFVHYQQQSFFSTGVLPDHYLWTFGDPSYFPYRLTDDGQEVILYDYTMEVGDAYAHVEGHDDITVVAKDMVATQDGDGRRRLTLSNGLVLIEGLGCINSNGLLLDYLNPASAYQSYFSYLDKCYADAEFSNLIYENQQPVVDTWQSGIGAQPSGMQGGRVAAPLFDLQGRRLAAAPAKGFYIKDGRKQVVK